MSESIAILCMLPKELCDEVINWGMENIDDVNLSNKPNKGRDKGPHITLATGVSDENSEGAIPFIEGYGQFDVELGNIEKFEKLDKGYDVIKIGVDSPQLKSLREEFVQNFEISDPITPYSPHITIAYVLPGTCDHLLENDSFSGKKIPISSMVYSDREKGGKIFNLKKREPLKESLDYGSPGEDVACSLEAVEAYLADHNISIKSLSARDMGRIIIGLSNKNL